MPSHGEPIVLHLLTRARRFAGRALFLGSVPPLRRWLRGRRESPDDVPPAGLVRFGDLRRLRPVSRNDGADRGGSIRQHYARTFIDARRPGSSARVATPEDPTALLGLAPASFDCIIVSDVMEFADDPHELAGALHGALTAGGVVLVTAAGIAPNGRSLAGDGTPWRWHYTALSMRRLFGAAFGEEHVEVVTFGSVFTAAAALHGVAVVELSPSELEYHDPDYEVVIGVRAWKTDR